ncbi:mannose-1-phosphate guanylyltransferase [Bacteroidales bacterium]|nr:mannose-1-phosphate guanylyltransferase [Bacteroidales bacterium]
MNNNYCVIMAGGIGSRFWPLSKTRKPKQFLDVLGTGKTLIQQTWNRFAQIIPEQNILIVTNDIYSDIIKEQIPQITDDQILCEPMRRNTAPCIAYANHKIMNKCKDANIVVAPSDHLIMNEQDFLSVINKGLDFVANNDALLTLGIKPSRPETGYGYIQIEPQDETILNSTLTPVKLFTEKPNIEMAKDFYEDGNFYWNAGIFLWSLKTINAAFDKYLPDVNSLFYDGADAYNTEKENEFISNIYPQCQNISIDYGIMENADNKFVLLSEFGWSDLGTWGSLYEKIEKDKTENAIKGNNVFIHDSENNIVNVPDEKLVVLQGLKDMIVVESDDILLVCKKEDEQKIKHYVKDVSIKLGNDYI